MFTSSSAILRGIITGSQNTSDGAAVNGQSILEIRGAQVQLNNNEGAGLVAGSGQVAIFGFTTAQGSTLTASGNGDSGMIIFAPQSQSLILGSDFIGSGANIITAANNGVNGLFVVAGFIASPFGTAKFVLASNVKTSLSFGSGAGAVSVGGLNVQNNGTGVLADGAGIHTLVSIPPNPSVIENKYTDVDLKFGRRVTVDGIAIGTITCDATVLSRGTTVTTCPRRAVGYEPPPRHTQRNH